MALGTAPGESAVSVRCLTKSYGGRQAVDGISFDIAPAEICGLVGPDGAGKSTTLRMLLGLVRPSSGTGSILGCPIDRPAGYLHRVGAMIGNPAFYPNLTGRRNLRVLAELGGLRGVDLDDLLDQVGLTGRADCGYAGYSFGLKRRLGIAAALLGDPELLILDEPGNGLDPAGAAAMRELLRSIAAAGRTVLVTGRQLAEIENLADRVVFLRAGRLIFSGSMTELRSATRARTIAVPEDRAELTALTDVVRRLGLTTHLNTELGGLEIETDNSALINRSAHEDGILLASIRVTRPSLEEIFLPVAGSIPAAAPDLAMTA
jgi:ABC-2 type transport system ATP-binding protein